METPVKIVRMIALGALVLVASLTVASGKAKLDGGVPTPCPPYCPIDDAKAVPAK